MGLFNQTINVLKKRKEDKQVEKARQEIINKNALIPVLKGQTLKLIEDVFKSDLKNEINYINIKVDEFYAQEFISVMNDLKEWYEIVQTSSCTYMIKQKIIEVL